MAINNVLNTVLPFYNSTAYQQMRRWGLYEQAHEVGDTEMWVCNNQRLLPFQFKRPFRIAGVTALDLICFVGGETTDVLAILDENIEIKTAGDSDYITYFAAKDLMESLPCGTFYLKLTDENGVSYYSEVFIIKDIPVSFGLPIGSDGCVSICDITTNKSICNDTVYSKYEE